MILTKLQEGLGNQLFQYFFTRSIGDNNYKFDTSFYNSSITRKLELTKFKNLKLNFLSVYDDLQNMEFVLIRDNNKYFDVKSLDPNLNYLFDGYWQNYRYLEPIKNLINEELKISDDLIKYIYTEYPFIENSISVHIRRGDYVNLQDYYYLLDADYYNNALRLFPKDSNILIFSDDINWCKANIQYPHVFFIEENMLTEFYMMSMCQNNIIANSTFSFWAAYLNTHLNKKVIAPKNWFKEKYSLLISNGENPDCSSNLILDNWVRI